MSRPGAKASSIKLLRVDGIHAPVEIRRHPTARRLTLRVSRTQRSVILTIPRTSDFREADKFLARSLDWVRERLDSLPDPVPAAVSSSWQPPPQPAPPTGTPKQGLAFSPAGV